jgi:hypothetical protein
MWDRMDGVVGAAGYPSFTGRLRMIQWSPDLDQDEGDAVQSGYFDPMTVTFPTGVSSGSIDLPDMCATHLTFRLELTVKDLDDNELKLFSGSFTFIESLVWAYPSPGMPMLAEPVALSLAPITFLNRVSEKLNLMKDLSFIVLDDENYPGKRGLTRTPWGIGSFMGIVSSVEEETITVMGDRYHMSAVFASEFNYTGHLAVKRTAFFDGIIGSEIPEHFYLFPVSSATKCDDVSLASFFAIGVYGADNTIVGDRLLLGWEPLPLCQLTATNLPLRVHSVTFMSMDSAHLSVHSTYRYLDDLMGPGDNRRNVTRQFTGVHIADEEPGVIIISFRGTDTLADWFVNLDIRQYDCDDIDIPCEMGDVHRGFMDELILAMPLLDHLFYRLKASATVDPTSIIFTGHSQGGAIAAIAAAYFTDKHDLKNVRLVTFGQPRAGGWDFRDFLEEKVGVENILRLDANNDMVPTVPAGIFWRHAGLHMETECDSWNPVECHSVQRYVNEALVRERPEEFRESNLLYRGDNAIAGESYRATADEEGGLSGSVALIVGVSAGALCCAVLCLAAVAFVLLGRRRRHSAKRGTSLAPTATTLHTAGGVGVTVPATGGRSRRASVSLAHGGTRRSSTKNLGRRDDR